MYRTLVLCLCLVLLPAVMAAARDGKKGKQSESVKQSAPGKQPQAKELSGMSIVGNDEAPKSLYIVPWKSSEIGAEADLNMVLNEEDVPVDREVFKRQLEFYEISTGK